MSYELVLTGRFQQRLEELPSDIQERIEEKLKEFREQLNVYGIDPRHHNSTKFITDMRTWRLRIGDHRAFFDIQKNTLKFTTVLPRSGAYQDR